MIDMSLIAVISIITAGLTVAIGSFGAAMGEGRAAAAAMSAIAQQPSAWRWSNPRASTASSSPSS